MVVHKKSAKKAASQSPKAATGQPAAAARGSRKASSPKAKTGAMPPAPQARAAKSAVKRAPSPPPETGSPDVSRDDGRADQPRKSPLTPKQLEFFRKQLLELRDRIVDGINFLAGENLNSQREASGDLSNYGMHMADQGTDNFDREFGLNIVSTEQDLLYEIDEALHRLDSGTYGICEITGRPIEIERLKAMPHARYCLAAQAEMERGRKRYRQFGPSGLSGGIET